MEILQALNINEKQLLDINSDAYGVYFDLFELEKFIETGSAPENIIQNFNKLYKSFETFLNSTNFKEKAASKGIILGTIDIKKPEIKNPKPVEIVTEVVTETEPVEDVLDFEELFQEKEEKNAQKERFGVLYKSDKRNYSIRSTIQWLLTYGSDTNDLKYYSNKNNYYLLRLPKLQSVLVFNCFQDHKNNDDLSEIVDSFSNGKTELSIISNYKKNNEEIQLILTSSSSSFDNKKTLYKSDLLKDEYDLDNYVSINSIDSRSINSTYFNVNESDLETIWETYSSDNDIFTHSFFRYGLNHCEFLYIPIKEYYKSGGLYTTAQNQVFYQPKIKKDLVFYQSIKPLTENSINTKEYKSVKTSRTKDIKFTTPTKPICSNAIGDDVTKHWTYFQASNGKKIKIRTITNNYFVKYYGELTYSIDNNYLYFYSESGLEGFAEYENFVIAPEYVQVYSLEESQSLIRSIIPNITELKDVNTIYELDFLKSTPKKVSKKEKIENLKEKIKKLESLKDFGGETVIKKIQSLNTILQMMVGSTLPVDVEEIEAVDVETDVETTETDVETEETVEETPEEVVENVEETPEEVVETVEETPEEVVETVEETPVETEVEETPKEEKLTSEEMDNLIDSLWD